MRSALAVNALIKLLSGFIIIALLLFLPAGTLHFSNGWLLMGLLFIPMLILGMLLLAKNPSLLEKRLQTKEKEVRQKGVIAASLLMFTGGFAIAGLDFRFGWSSLPTWLIITASVIFLFSYFMYAEVLRENTYLSRTVEIQQEQKVIDTGLYGIIRHPMYTATILMFLSMPLILGSLISFILFLAYPVIIIVRLKNEEQVLEEGLEGYTEYKKKVKYRLLPFIW
ncbi:MAG: isoprenylcysteine carboxylmethyltransferase family protein [Oscillospiraceae bacterium]|nr:isoprenylcysteine carboxylmethyltransferase family protein [Oscillospiraceae bacterium]